MTEDYNLKPVVRDLQNRFLMDPTERLDDVPFEEVSGLRVDKSMELSYIVESYDPLVREAVFMGRIFNQGSLHAQQQSVVVNVYTDGNVESVYVGSADLFSALFEHGTIPNFENDENQAAFNHYVSAFQNALLEPTTSVEQHTALHAAPLPLSLQGPLVEYFFDAMFKQLEYHRA